jgi:hypothetical protein
MVNEIRFTQAISAHQVRIEHALYQPHGPPPIRQATSVGITVAKHASKRQGTKRVRFAIGNSFNTQATLAPPNPIDIKDLYPNSHGSLRVHVNRQTIFKSLHHGDIQARFPSSKTDTFLSKSAKACNGLAC